MKAQRWPALAGERLRKKERICRRRSGQLTAVLVT
jgi:hypothetical protein